MTKKSDYLLAFALLSCGTNSQDRKGLELIIKGLKAYLRRKK